MGIAPCGVLPSQPAVIHEEQGEWNEGATAATGLEWTEDIRRGGRPSRSAVDRPARSSASTQPGEVQNLANIAKRSNLITYLPN